MADFDNRGKRKRDTVTELKEVFVPKCGLSKVEPHTAIVIENTNHAGLITHVCALLKKHTDKYCKCACGHSWQRWEA